MKLTLTPSTIHPPFGRYAHGVKATGSGILVASGQLGIGPDGTVPADAEAQARICMDSIVAILREGGLTLSDVVRLNAFVTHHDYFAPYMAVRDEYLADLRQKPASTLVVAAGLSRPEFLVEIEATAVF
ncbi:RidA family protein [Oceanicola sp. 502str15]|uniref:RidA family protein n=1 Tax=Oceanicola sp. 502str15 TaxID=2696061 RepID=UPI002095DC11|nr:RidA family protein [Oceanicola sp. 502str15]MCO6382681.1 RidA family protein [Oceanicola sp. 502str15]